MNPFDIRKTVITTETIHHDGGAPPAQPLRLAVAAAVMANPFAGRPGADLMEFQDALKPLAVELSQQLLDALRVEPTAIEVFGKGSIVGTDGELEHAAAWHAPGGAGIKQVLNARGFVSAGKMMGVLGARLQIPLVYINSPWVRSHFNSIELSIYDAPKPRELVFALAVGTGGRIHARLGGVTPAQAEAGEAPRF
jgi:amino acid synthesis protein